MDLRFWISELKICKSTFRNRKSEIGGIMLKNYLKIALRTLYKYKGYSIINILGLAIGMATCIIILLWVQDEMSYDRFFKNSKNLYRVYAEFYSNESWAVTPIPLAPALKSDFPEIADVSRYRSFSALIENNNVRFNERGAFVDPSFLTMFSFPLLNGDAITALTDPYSIVITETMADKYFGDNNPLGKTIKIDNVNDYKITGVLKSNPGNSHFRFNFLLPFEIFLKKDRGQISWERFQLRTYVLLNEDVQSEKVEASITELLDQHNPENDIKLHLQPLTQIHLHNLNGGGNIEYVYIFSIIALFVLLIACINFMNLTTARSSTRTKEIGMRKVTGASKFDFIKQFMGESILLSLFAFIIAINIVYLVLPIFNDISGKMLNLNLIKNIDIGLGLIGLLLLTGIISGSYPTFFLAAFKPVAILKANSSLIKKKNKDAILRKSLVILQFSISIFLLIVTLVISRQLNFLLNKDPGYNSEQVVYLPMKGDLKQQNEPFKNELLQNRNIVNVAATSGMLVDMLSSYDGFDWDGKNPDKRYSFVLGAVDFDYLQTLKMEMTDGRGFSKKYLSDETGGFIVNQAAIEAMGMKNPIEKRFSFEGRQGWRHGTIVGVVKNFHFQSLHNKIEPFVMMIQPDRYNYFCLRIKPGTPDISETLTFVENTWKKFVPNYPFEYSFLDEEFESLYRAEQRTKKIFSYFSFLAMFISCLGLFGLSSFTAERRTKEIGIRKVLGASVPGIMRLLNKEFLFLIAVSNLIAWIFSYFIIKKWLQNFAYHIELGWYFFVISGLLAMFFALVVVSIQSSKVAFQNPVESLRYE